MDEDCGDGSSRSEKGWGKVKGGRDFKGGGCGAWEGGEMKSCSTFDGSLCFERGKRGT